MIGRLIRVLSVFGFSFVFISPASANSGIWDQVKLLQQQGVEVGAKQAKGFETFEVSRGTLRKFLKGKGVNIQEQGEGEPSLLVRRVSVGGQSVELLVYGLGDKWVSVEEQVQILGSLRIPFK